MLIKIIYNGFVKLAVDADAQFFGELFPCAVVVFGGIGDDAVEVKKHCGFRRRGR